MPSSRMDMLASLNFGASAAENEAVDIQSYFVETYQWKKFERGTIDIVFGNKGSGKSAIYQLTKSKVDDFFDKDILLVFGEKSSQPLAFDVFNEIGSQDIERARNIWKLYILSLIVRELYEFQLQDARIESISSALMDLGLLEKKITLKRVLRRIFDYVRRLGSIESVEPTVNVDPNTGVPTGVSSRIVFREPSENERMAGVLQVDEALAACTALLGEKGLSIWPLIDRLDSIFSEDPQKEAIYIRALFDIYRGLMTDSNISIKIFLRTDIWEVVSEGRFREASHIERHETLRWSDPAIANLIVRRVLHNSELVDFIGIDKRSALEDLSKQPALIDRILQGFPKFGISRNSPFERLLTCLRDGAEQVTPRDVIQFLNNCREAEIEHLDRGTTRWEDDSLFSSWSMREALVRTSLTKINQTIFAEYPELISPIKSISAFRWDHFREEQIEEIFGQSKSDADQSLNILLRIGFLGKRRDFFFLPRFYKFGLFESGRSGF